MSDNKYQALIRELREIVKYLKKNQFSHGNWEDGNWAADEAAQLIEKAISASESEENS